MAPRGPKPKPTRLKLLQGTARKHRLARAEPEPETVSPTPPDHLAGPALEEWGRVVAEMVRLGIMSRLDR
ncbi:phage terminase small subunit P27 family, partial [Lutimaribacter marinistellae]